jgi:hypothetical protein
LILALLSPMRPRTNFTINVKGRGQECPRYTKG